MTSEGNSGDVGTATSGVLQVVATPIGHLDDLGGRAAEALRVCDLVASEDTRHTGRLLAHLGVRRPQVSVHEHNEDRRIPRVLGHLEAGETVALVSDAGTPLISDPGFRLVRAALAAGHRVETIPGPSALLAALVLSGLPPTPFTFAGFPPPKSGKRRKLFRRLAELSHTVIVYESPHRIGRCLADALEEFGDRPAALCRELTKLHEETLRGTLAELVEEDRRRERWKGELVLVVGPREGSLPPQSSVSSR